MNENIKGNNKELNSNKQIEEIYQEILITGRELLGKPVLNVEKYVAEHLYKASYRKETQGEWLSAYDYALKLGITDEKRLADAKADKWWKFCSYCEQQVKGFHNYCPNCGAKMKGE